MQRTTADLERQARSFAHDVSDLLNGTVTRGQRIGSVLTPQNICIVGRGVSRQKITPKRIPLAVRAKATPTCHLLVAHTFTLDEQGVWLTSSGTSYGVYLTDDPNEEPLFRYDYDRTPENPYPEAHFHVRGESAELQELMRRADREADEMHDLHFPMGGRRFRVSLEDLVEFLIVERLAEDHDGWQEKIDEHRRKWEEAQVKATVRRYPDWAREGLETLD